MIRVLVGDVPGITQRQVLRIRHDDQRNARAVAEEVDRLHIAGVVVAAALILGDENDGVLGVRRRGLDLVDDLLHEALEQVQLRGGRMAVHVAAGLDEGNRGQVPLEISAYRFTVSWICAATCAGFAMMEVSYWNGLQMLQYSSAPGPSAVVQPYGSLT
jgi:hypothetical protein